MAEKGWANGHRTVNQQVDFPELLSRPFDETGSTAYKFTVILRLSDSGLREGEPRIGSGLKYGAALSGVLLCGVLYPTVVFFWPQPPRQLIQIV